MKMEIILCMRWLKVVSSCICDQRLEFLLSESWEIPEPEVCPNLTSCLLVWNIWIFCSRRYHKCIDFRQILLWNDRWLSRQPVSHLQPGIEFGPKNQRSVPLGNYFAIQGMWPYSACSERPTVEFSLAFNSFNVIVAYMDATLAAFSLICSTAPKEIQEEIKTTCMELKEPAASYTV